MKRLIIATILTMFSFPAMAAEEDIWVLTRWGCPTADGPLSIAKAARDGANSNVAGDAAGCSRFPYPVPTAPVKFIVETEGGNGFLYVWEVKFEGADTTFFANFDISADTWFRKQLNKSSL